MAAFLTCVAGLGVDEMAYDLGSSVVSTVVTPIDVNIGSTDLNAGISLLITNPSATQDMLVLVSMVAPSLLLEDDSADRYDTSAQRQTTFDVPTSFQAKTSTSRAQLFTNAVDSLTKAIFPGETATAWVELAPSASVTALIDDSVAVESTAAVPPADVDASVLGNTWSIQATGWILAT